MKIPLLSRCFLKIPTPTIGDNECDNDDASYSSSSMSSKMSYKELYFNKSKNPCMKNECDNNNLLARMRNNALAPYTKTDYAIAARQALGLDDTQFQVTLSEPVPNNSVTTSQNETMKIVGIGEIDCKDIHKSKSMSTSIPKTIGQNGNTSSNKRCSPCAKEESISVPSSQKSRARTTPTTRQCSSRSLLSSGMDDDQTCSGHSIIEELKMEEYVDPYKEFLKDVESSLELSDKVDLDNDGDSTDKTEDEFETDILTQLPSIKSTYSPKKSKKKIIRRNTMHNTSAMYRLPSSSSSLPSRRGSLSNNTRVDSDSVHDSVMTTRSLPSSSINNNINRSNVVARPLLTNNIGEEDQNSTMKQKSISVMTMQSSKPQADTTTSTSTRKEIEFRCRNVFPIHHHSQKRRSTIATSSTKSSTTSTATGGSYHGRLEL